MNRTNETVTNHTPTSNPSRATPKDHGALADAELDAATGGSLLRGSNGNDRKGGRYL